MARKDSRNRWDIEDAVPKGAENDGRVADVGKVSEHHLQNWQVLNDWSSDGGNKEEDGSNEEEEGADMVKHVEHHFVCLFSRWR
jgi:hypothetical protein